jgi:hypothetical protein
MADVAASNGLASQQVAEKTPFEKQRDGLIGQITQVSLSFQVSQRAEHGANPHKLEPP